MIVLAPLYTSIDALAAAYRAAGGVIGSTETVVAPSDVVNCAGTPPTFFNGWIYRASDQLPNLYKGMLDMQEVAAVQAPSQANGWTRLDVIQRELANHEFVSAHAAEWYMRPENLAAFLRVCPSGYLVFVEKYRGADRYPRVVCLCVQDGRVCVDIGFADDAVTFGAQNRFAVRRKLSA